MVSQKFSFQDKSYGGYIGGIILLLMVVPPSLSFFPIFGIIMFFVSIAAIVNQYTHNKKIPENNVLYKYLQYLEEIHSEIPEKYYSAMLDNLRNLHYSSFGKFEETITFSPDELDQHINEFMEDADNYLKKYRSRTLSHANKTL